jgi:ankyrin repeat protein
LLVNAGVNVHQREADGSNALHWAVNSPILTRLLLDAGVDANATSSDGATPLHKAKRIEVMCLLITSGGADINKRDKEGKTPLLSRFMDRFHGTADLDRFLEFGPDCSVVDNEGNSVLHYLLQDANHREVTSSLRNLLAMGADPNCRNYSGDLPLHRIWPDPKVPDQILDLLLAAGVDMNARDKQGATLLFRVIWSQFDKSSAFIELLLEKGASLAVRDFQGRTLLHEAIKKGSVPAGLEFLLARGLDPSAVDNYGNNLLHELAMRSCNYDFYGHQAMVGVWKQLLSLGLDLSQRNYTGRTPLHILCCSQIQFKTFKPSVMLPIDFVISEMKTSGGMTVDVVDNAGITPLHLAATISGIYAQKLLDAGADPTRATMEGRTSLHLAAQSRASNIVGILLDGLYRRQMTEALPTGNLIDKTIAVLPRGSWYREKTFQFSARAINAQDAPRPSPVGKSGWTPLSYACRSGRPETVALLLKAGAEVTFGRLVEACVGFEQEQSLWNRDHQRGEDLDTGGLRFADSSRPSVSDGNFPDLNTQTARIDEILEMLLEKGMEFDTVEGVSHKYHNYHNYLTDTAFKDRRDYTVGCLATARALQNEYKKGMGQKSGANTYAMHQRRCVQEAALRSLTDFEGLKKGEGNEALFLSLIIRRDYSVVRELSRAGADFFQQGLERRSNNFGVLASLGFASLAESIIRDLCAKSKASDKEEIKQAQSCSSLPNMTFRSYDPSDHSKNASHLLMAVRRALPNMEMVRLLVEDCGVDINELHIGSDGNITDSPLLSVAKGEQWWHAALAVPYFIGQSANLNIRNYHGQTPLHIALREGNNGSCGFFRNDVVRALVKAGADVNATDTQGRSCLAYAGRDTTLVRLLIENGAKVSPHALFAAIDSNNYEVLQTLLSAGADPNMRRPEVGNPPKAQSRIAEGQLFAVQHAAKTHEIEGWYRLRAEEKAVLNGVRVKMVETLLAYGADPFATFLQRLIFGDVNYKKQCEEWTAFILKSNDPHLSEPHTVTARTRVMYEASKIPKGYEQCTILHDLVENDLMIEPFLQLTDLDVDHRDPKGRSLLLSACNSRNGPDTLIEIPPSHVEESGSASAASQSILRYLLSRGADPLARDNEGRNALHQMLDGIEKKQNYGWKDSLSYMAKTYPTLVDQMDKWGKTPLHLALQLATRRVVGTELVVTFLRAGADPLLTDGEGNSSLHILAHGLDRPAVRELFEDLLNRGCDINARNIHGETPLGSSRYFRRRTHPKDSNGVRNDVGQKSLWETSGADISIFDNAGRGFLHLAARETATRLQEPMQRGLDPMMEDENRQTPLDVAAASGNKNIFALFERKRE